MLPTLLIGVCAKLFTIFCEAGLFSTEIILFIDGPIRMDEPKSGRAMIELTRLNKTPIVLNSDLIKTAEASPDTMLTLVNGEKLIVRESTAEVTERVLAYRARLLASVARRLPTFGDMQPVVALASLDVSGQPAPPATRKQDQEDNE